MLRQDREDGEWWLISRQRQRRKHQKSQLSDQCVSNYNTTAKTWANKFASCIVYHIVTKMFWTLCPRAEPRLAMSKLNPQYSKKGQWYVFTLFSFCTYSTLNLKSKEWLWQWVSCICFSHRITFFNLVLRSWLGDWARTDLQLLCRAALFPSWGVTYMC